MAGHNPLLAGLSGRCPSCGEGHLFDGFLKVAPRCEACGYDPSPRARDVRHHLRTAPARPVLDLGAGRSAWIDWSVGSSDPRDAQGVLAMMADLDVLAGHYAEDRDVYRGEAFEGEERTVHLGLDLFQPAGSKVYAPYDGVVEVVEARPAAGDYGHVVILRHRTAAGTPFWTLYGHLGPSVVDDLQGGADVAAGARAAETALSEAEGVIKAKLQAMRTQAK